LIPWISGGETLRTALATGIEIVVACGGTLRGSAEGFTCVEENFFTDCDLDDLMTGWTVSRRLVAQLTGLTDVSNGQTLCFDDCLAGDLDLAFGISEGRDLNQGACRSIVFEELKTLVGNSVVFL